MSVSATSVSAISATGRAERDCRSADPAGRDPSLHSGTLASSPPDLASLLQQPYRAGDPAYAAALWRATVQRLADRGRARSRHAR